MDNKHLVIAAFLHFMLAILSAVLFWVFIHDEYLPSWMGWVMFASVWVNVWVASRNWTMAYENV